MEAQVKEAKVEALFDIDVEKAVRDTKLRLCYQCAMCGGTCPVARLRDDYRPMLLFMRVNLGDVTLLQDRILWYCTTCYNCQEVCLQGVEATEMIFRLKNLATKLGNVPMGVKKFGEALIKDGVVVPVTDFTNKKRKSVGLPSIPPSDKDEIQKIVKRTGFDKLIGYKWGGKDE